MMNYLGVLGLSFWISVIFAHDASYYQAHPQDLQEAIQACPNKSPREISCEALKNIAFELNDLARQLQSNPQAYGQQILALQETLAAQEHALEKDSNRAELKDQIRKSKQELNQYMTVARWLLSPT